ncbi:MAG: carboxypeptidase-like regulatory domain-containing protein [Kiritimatiellae bacterium]|nr:carboxypeptidase-like regulatory domain-containing protein [Kiritimatiellia bacterium]
MLTEHASLTLEVFDCDGARLPAAAFAVFAPAGNAAAYDAGITDMDGAGTVHGLPAGPVDYSVDEAFHNPADLTCTLVAGTHATQRVDLAAATHLSGIVRAVDGSGARIEGAKVDLYTPEPDALLIASDTTDAFGQYRFSRVIDGDYQLAASHPAYTPAVTGITVTASASHTLVMQPRSGTFSDVHVQVHGALSGLPIAGAEVLLSVYESGGNLIYQQTIICDADGNLCFRGVPSGTAYFDCNRPGANHQPWWEHFSSPPQEVANSKMVTVRLEPKKGQTTVDLDFAPTSAWGSPIDPAPFIQNFWVEARGYDPETGAPLYPARTEVTDYAGKAFFEELPTLPTLITVRRPGFVAQSTLIYPDNNAVFPSLVPMDRPAITPETVWNLTVTQTLFRCFPYAMSGMPAIYVEGLPNSNTEGYFEDYRYATKVFAGLPMPLETAHGEMSAWGQGQYLLSPGAVGYLYTGVNLDSFYCQFDFAPHLVTLAEGENNDHQIAASFVPSIVEGTLFAADSVTDEGVTLYTPAPNKEIKFLLHEAVRFMYQNGTAVCSATTDTNGYYRLAVPPGCYGIEIPSMEGYWGYKVIASGLVGWSNGESGWPYARTNNWGVSGASYVYDDSGIGLGSGHQTQLDLYVHRNRYAIQTAVTEESPLRERILFLTADGQDGASKNVKDLLESGTRLSLSDGSSTPIRQAAGSLRAVWTNLVGGTLTITGEDHPYLSSSSVVSRVTFDWGEYPGAPPASVPPTGSLLNATPLPMILHNTPAFTMASENELGDKPTISVIYYDGDETPAQTTTLPQYVAFKDHPGRVYYCYSVDAARVDTYYFPFTLHDGTRNLYAVPGAGPYVVNTISQLPAELPLAPYDMDVVAVNFDNPAETIEGFPFKKNGEPMETPCHYDGLETSVSVDWDYDAPSAWQRYSYNSIHYDVNPTNSPLLVTAKLYCRPRVLVNGSVKNALSGLPIQGANVEIRRSNATTMGLENKSDGAGAFSLSVFNSFDGHLVSVNATGYLPFRKRYEFGSRVTGTNDNYFTVSLGDITLVPATLTVANDSWDRQGYVLHGVQSAGNGEESETGEAVQLTVSAAAGVPAQAYEIQQADTSDGSPGSVEAMRGTTRSRRSGWSTRAEKPDRAPMKSISPRRPRVIFR